MWGLVSPELRCDTWGLGMGNALWLVELLWPAAHLFSNDTNSGKLGFTFGYREMTCGLRLLRDGLVSMLSCH